MGNAKYLVLLVYIVGSASYYSRLGCLGCNKDLIMANGEILDDRKLTVAMVPATIRRNKLLNQFVTITNMINKKSVRAKVTDSGGFSKYNRIADLSVATKNTIGCSDICKVVITW